MIQNNPVEIMLTGKSSNLYVFFGGITAGIAIPPFEFYNASNIIDEHKIFIRDFAQCWYHTGLPGISNDIDSTADFINQQIKKLNPEKIYFVGNSMGGFAAILFASLLGKGDVIAFAPQTFISPLLRLKYGDNRWEKQIFNTLIQSMFKKKVWNLKQLLLKKNQNRKISIFVSNDDELDYIHSLHLKNIPGVSVYEFKGGGHEIVKLLRDKGKLPDIMSGSYA